MALLLWCACMLCAWHRACSQLIASGSAWPGYMPSVYPHTWTKDPFVEAVGNDPTECRTSNGKVVTCKQVRVLWTNGYSGPFPMHINFAHHMLGLLMLHTINQEQILLPGYEIVIDVRDNKGSAQANDLIVADDVSNFSSGHAACIAAQTSIDGFVYLLDKHRMPVFTSNINEAFSDPEAYPMHMSAINSGGQIMPIVRKIFARCGWQHVGLIYDPQQFSYEADAFQQKLQAEGVALDFVKPLGTDFAVDGVIADLKASRTRVVFVWAEGAPMVRFVCGLHLHRVGGVTIVHFLATPWMYNFADAFDERCRNPDLLMDVVKENYIGIMTATADRNPYEDRMTCANTSKAAYIARGEQVLGTALASGQPPFGPVPHFAHGDLACHLALYLRHMLIEQGFTLQQVSERTTEVYDAYKSWAWPSFYGASGYVHMAKKYSPNGKFTGLRKPFFEIYQMRGNNSKKTPMANSPPPWDFGPLIPNYEELPDGTFLEVALDQIQFAGGFNATHCPPSRFDPCPDGHELLFGVCTACHPGNFWDSGGECKQCPEGQYQGLFAQTICLACKPGEYNNLKQQSECRLCREGTHRPPGVAATACIPCSAGSFAASQGQSSCELCDVGRTQPSNSSRGATRCSKCPGDFTTEQAGATNVSSCACPAGSYQTPQNPALCTDCPEGMSCAFGSSMMGYETAKANQFSGGDSAVFPLLQVGYYSSQEDLLSVFKCSRSEICPGGVPGSCAGGRIGLNCVDCPPNHYLDGDTCAECKGTEGVGPAILILILSFSLAVCMHVAGNWPMVKGRAAIILTSTMFSMAVTLFMTISTYGSLDVAWTAPLDKFWPIFNIVEFDLEIIRFSCLTGSTGFVNMYVVKLLIFPIACFSACLGAFVLSKIERTKSFANCNCTALQNTAGFVMAALFVAISLLSLDGFKCQINPNGLFTLAARSSVVCWEDGDHSAIVALSSLAILAYPVSFLALSAYACCNFGKLSERHGLAFTNRVRFLSNRMQPSQVMFGFWWNLRNFALSLVPVAVANSFPLQIFLLALIFSFWLLAQLITRCWRFEVLNYVDALVSSVQVLTFVLFGMLPTTEASPVRESIGWFVIFSIVSLLVSLLAGAAIKIARHYSNKGCIYDAFVSHHKAAAALASRHIKTLLTSYYNTKVFLDVDELDNLDNLTFAVKETKHIIVVLTNEILSRPWCAVELATAFSTKVPVCLVQLNQDQVELTPEFLDASIAAFTPQDWTVLSTSGISLSLLRDAYEAISKLPKRQLYLNSGREVQMGVLREALGQGTLQGYSEKKNASLDPEKIAYLVYDIDNTTQASVALILATFMRGQQQWNTILLNGHSKPYQLEQKSMCITLMSKGLVSNAAGLGAAVSVYRAGMTPLAVISQEPFWKPEFDYPSFWRDLALDEVLTRSQLSDVRLYVPGTNGAEIAAAMMPLYKMLALGLNPQIGMSIFTAEANVMMERAAVALQRQRQAVEDGTAKTRSPPEEVFVNPQRMIEVPPPALPPALFTFGRDDEELEEEIF